MSRNLAYLECVLNMRCFGRLGCKHFSLHTTPKGDHGLDPDDTEHYIFHGVRAHQSHAMATHWDLKLHFCTFCGAYSQHRSKHLAKPCSLAPSMQGREAPGNILKGKRPDRHVFAWRNRQEAKPPTKAKRASPKALLKRVRATVIRKGPANKMPPPDFTCKTAPPLLAPSSGACHQCKKQGGEQLGRCVCDDIAVAELNGQSFSVGLAKEQVQCIPCNTQGSRPSPSGQASYHLACPKHSGRRSWTIDEYCEECDDLALAALASTSSQ